MQQNINVRARSCAARAVALNGRRYWREGESVQLECSVEPHAHSPPPPPPPPPRQPQAQRLLNETRPTGDAHSKRTPLSLTRRHERQVRWERDGVRLDVDVDIEDMPGGQRKRKRRAAAAAARVRSVRLSDGALVSTLEVRGVRAHHSGRYTCSYGGAQSAPLHLLVLPTASASASVSASASDATAHVSGRSSWRPASTCTPTPAMSSLQLQLQLQRTPAPLPVALRARAAAATTATASATNSQSHSYEQNTSGPNQKDATSAAGNSSSTGFESASGPRRLLLQCLLLTPLFRWLLS